MAAWPTVGYERTVVVVVRTVAALTRLLDIVALLAPDRRIQTLFTYDEQRPAVLAAGVRELLARIEAPVVPWQQARGSGFDLALAASENDRLDELQAPVLLVPHGVGFQKYYPDSTVVSGMSPQRLVRDGQVVPAAVAVAHSQLRDQLRRVVPEAAVRSAVVGDPSLDRMLASRHLESLYRAAFQARGRRLVVLCSTWGRDSLLGVCPDLPDRLVSQLPVDEYRVAVVTHPGVVAAHGSWQVRAWLSEAERYGLSVVAPESGWQAALLAASCVISDQGSLSLYAAALDKPLLLSPGDPASTVPGSALSGLAAGTARIDPDGELYPQVESAIDGHLAGANDEVTGSVFEAPGSCARRLRSLLYRLLELAEPPWEPEFTPVPVPLPVPSPSPSSPSPSPSSSPPGSGPALVVGARVTSEEVALVRYPDLRRGRPQAGLDFRHVVVDVAAATAGQLDGATILWLDPQLWADGDWERSAATLLARWPAAVMVATGRDDRSCAVRTRDHTAMLYAPDSGGAFDPMLLASLAYVRLQTRDGLPERDRLRTAGRVIPVVVEAG